MVTVVKIVALVLSLGMDTLTMSISLGAAGMREKLKIAAAFASAEAMMPIVGLFIGQSAAKIMGTWSDLVGGVALLGVAVWFIFLEDGDEIDSGKRQKLRGWVLLLTALSISIDELAVGFSIGLIGVPVALTIILIAIQAVFFTLLGLTVGSRVKPILGEWSEKLAGVVLGLVGLWMIGFYFIALVGT